MEGRYNIVIEAPRRKEPGTVIFMVKGNILRGTVTAMGITSRFSDGKIDGDEFEFSGEVKLLMKKTPYVVRGRVDGDVLTAVAYSKFGTFDVRGTKY